MAAAVRAAVEMAEAARVAATAEEAMAAVMAADRTPRPHSSARLAAPSSGRSCTPRCRHPAATRGTRPRRRPRAGTRPTPTPAPRRARSHRGAPREAPRACTDERRGGCTAPAPRPMSRCAGSHPCPLTSCHKRRTYCHTPNRAPNTAASTCAAKVWAAVTAAVTAAGMAVVAMAVAAKAAEMVEAVTEAVTGEAATAAEVKVVEGYGVTGWRCEALRGYRTLLRPPHTPRGEPCTADRSPGVSRHSRLRIKRRTTSR